MNAGPLILGVLLLAIGGFFAGQPLVSATRPVWGKYFKGVPTTPKARKTVPTPMGKAVGRVMQIGMAAFCLSFGGLLIASVLAANTITGWLGVITLVSAGLVILCTVIFTIFGSVMSTPAKPNARRPSA